MWFHVEAVSRLTGTTLILLEAKDKEEAKHEAYKVINRNGFNRFVKAVLDQSEYEKKYGPCSPVAAVKDRPLLFQCSFLTLKVSQEECLRCQKIRAVPDCKTPGF